EGDLFHPTRCQERALFFLTMLHSELNTLKQKEKTYLSKIRQFYVYSIDVGGKRTILHLF
ncbi:hypothetical protein, partial [Longicatena caecimuris]|uniref:hypothetical protein n=1 Tax=Longicatena caecimuris TaxID=1796635 RepID=UPI0022E00F9F